MRLNYRWLAELCHLCIRPVRDQSLLPILIAAVILSIFAANQMPSVHSFFQSPVSPTDTPVPPPPPTDTPVPPTNTPEPTPTPPPAEEPPTNTPEPAEAPTQPPAEPTAPPPEPLPATDTPVPPQPVEQNPPNPEPQPQAPAAEPPQPQPEAADPATLAESVEDSSGLVINQVELIDTAVQWFAWLWLCFGVGAVLLVPMFFLYIQIRGVRTTR